MIDWQAIDTVLLDMDGTLLDLHFDSYFWLEHLPERYAQLHDKSAEMIRKPLIDRIMAERGTLNWYCLDYWTEQLHVPITALKREVSHLIAFRPDVEQFLAALAQSDKRAVIITNAHRDSLDIKIEKTALDQRVDSVICAHDFGVAKEDQQFWHQLQEVEPFDPARTLFIDDSLDVLKSAQIYGIKHLFTIAQPDSQQPKRSAMPFPAIDHFSEVLPVHSSQPHSN